MLKRTIYFFWLLFLFGLILRKTGISAASLLIVWSGITLVFLISIPDVMKWVNVKKGTAGRFYPPAGLLLGLIYLLLIAEHSYWIDFQIPSFVLLIILAGLSTGIYLQLTSQWDSAKHSLSKKDILLLVLSAWLLLIPFILLDSRKVHNLFRHTPYEAYLRKTHCEDQREKVDRLLKANQEEDEAAISKAELYFNSAIAAEKEGDYRKALHYLNLSIDLKPFEYSYYYKRGLLRLFRLDINNDVVFDAVKDFSETIFLNDTLSEAYFHRGIALGYLDKKSRACRDMEQAKSLNPSLDIREYQDRYCIEDSLFSE